MPRPTQFDITEALESHWEKREDGRWDCLAFPFGDYNETEARLITEACLILDAKVTTTITAWMINRIAVRLAALEDRLAYGCDRFHEDEP